MVENFNFISLIILKMTNEKQRQSIINTISTINTHSHYLIEIKTIYDKNDENLIKEMYLTNIYMWKITWTRHLKNNWKTNKTILDFINNMYRIMYGLGLIDLSN